MTITDLQKYIFFANVGAIFLLVNIFNIAGHKIESKIERRYFASLIFVMIIVCMLTIMAFYKIAFSEYFILIRGVLQPVLVSITTYYLYFKYLKNVKH